MYYLKVELNLEKFGLESSFLRYCLKYKLDKEKGVAAMAAFGERVQVALGDGLGRILLVQASGDKEKLPRLVASRVHWHSLPVTSLRHGRRRHFIEYSLESKIKEQHFC